MSNHLSRDQKRKAKLAKRAKKMAPDEGITPYSGRKYQADEWASHVGATEKAIHETIKLSNRTLTNRHVKTAFVFIIEDIRNGSPALLPEDTPPVAYTSGVEVEYLIWNIRRHWRLLVEDIGPVRSDDFVGILRTLLYSIEAHAWHTGEHRGYVHFIEGHIEQFL
jgi:hypothetical protein